MTMENMTVTELMKMLKDGNEQASDMLWELARADARKAWAFIDVNQVIEYMNGCGSTFAPQEIIDYLKYNELIDVNGEIRNVLETIDE